MSEWVECKLEDLITLQRGHDLPKSKMNTEGKIPVAGSNGIIGYHDEATTKALGVTIGRSGNLGNAFLYNEDFWAHNTTLYVKDFKGNDETFIYYLLKSMDFQQFNVGSAVPTLNRNHIHPLGVKRPPLPEQKAIASVLSSLDDKIDLLHRQNKTLEAMAETLFRQWFVEEADDSWEEKKLGEMLVVKRGGSPRPIHDYLSEDGHRWLKISDVSGLNSPFIFNIKEHIKEEGLNKTVFLKEGALVLSNSATPGIPKILAVDSCIHDGWLYFQESELSNYFLYLLFKRIRSHLLQQGNGSIFTNLKTDILREYEIKVPPNKLRMNFDELINPIFEKIFQSSCCIKTLTKARDIVLPKLISGEVRVEQ